MLGGDPVKKNTLYIQLDGKAEAEISWGCHGLGDWLVPECFGILIVRLSHWASFVCDPPFGLLTLHALGSSGGLPIMGWKAIKCLTCPSSQALGHHQRKSLKGWVLL